MNREAQFTLVEMMIVVAIVMVLAAIAIPQLNDMQLKAKRAEVPTNVAGIRTAAVAYAYATDPGSLSAADVPRMWVAADKTAVAWTTGTNFDALGWRPDGNVRGTYDFNISNATASANGKCDVDNNNEVAMYVVSQSLKAGIATSGIVFDNSYCVTAPETSCF